MRNSLKKLFRLSPNLPSTAQTVLVPGSDRRPLCDFQAFLEDVKARGLAPQLILDVGANYGKWTRMAKMVFADASFLLIEPQAEMREALDELCASYDEMDWVEVGAGSKTGKLALTIWEDLAGSSFLPKVEEQLLQEGQQREVDILTIDSLLAERSLGIPELVKLDIQGFELEALRGATSLFGVTELIILEVNLFSFMENQPTVREVIVFMGERGYEMYDIPGFLRRPHDGALGQLDIAFVKKNGILRRTNNW